MTFAPPDIKPVFWSGRTKEDLSDLPDDVRDTVGQALFEAQKGGKHSNAKPLSGYGDASAMEIVADYAGDTFRTIYTLRWPGRVCPACLPEEVEVRDQDAEGRYHPD